MLVERRRTALPGELLTRVGAVWVFVCALLLTIHWAALISGPVLGAERGFDLAEAPPGILTFILAPVFGSQIAHTASSVLMPLLTLGAAMLLSAHVSWKLLGDEEATLTALILAISVPVLVQLAPTRLDFYGWQMICALGAINGMMLRTPRLGGWIAGGSLAAWLEISIHSWPVIAAIAALLGLRWLQNREERFVAVAAVQSFTVFSAVFTFLAMPLGEAITPLAAASFVHLGILAWGSAVLTILAKLEPLPRGRIAVGFAFAIVGGVVIALVTAPYWLPSIAAASGAGPIWSWMPGPGLQYAITPFIGLIATINLASRSHQWLRKFWFDYAVILGAALAASVLLGQIGAVACVLAAPPLAWQARSWFRSIRSMRNPAPRAFALIAVALALLPSLPMVVASYAGANVMASPLIQ
ncbi:hypothetical protein [Erythrobacter sp. MTPC3]|uniref:hypothetical protein n=1 Tax=Erythrobacter sp. MTPC3 TaxID=3056564 RepID=UPI0036F3CC24